MVKIINGEIVQDDDPRLRNRTNASRPTQIPQTPNNPSYAQSSPSSGGATAANNPLEAVATALGINDKYIIIPPIQALGFSESKIPLLYMILLCLMFLIFGVRSLIFAVVVFGMYKHSERH